jgi:hypothetical protein
MADISKYSVVDPRILQQKPKYAVEKGAVSITNGRFSAIANSSSQQTFQVQVPSENIYVDRAVDWVCTGRALVTLNYAAVGDLPANGTVLATPGVNFSLAPFPTTQSVSTMQATINDQSLSINMADVLPQVLRLADLSKTRRQRTCPTMLDRYYDVQSAAAYPNSPVASYQTAFSNDEVPCGAWGDVSFYVPAVAGSAGAITLSAAPGRLPLAPNPGALAAGAKTIIFGVQWTTAEKLVLPPFIFADEDELSTGLFGVQNMQFTMNFNTPARSLRFTPGGFPGDVNPAAPFSVSWDGSSPFPKAEIQVQFLTPSLDVPLPAKSIVPWMEFPRYISPVQSIELGQNTNIQSQTITLPMIPDLLVLFVKPQSYTLPTGGILDSSQGDWVLPISNISLSFDNFSGLLSNHSQYELYKMSVNNGLEMDWDEWSGQARGAEGALVPLVGGPLVLRPGRDFALSSGQAPGLIGNFTLQFNLTVENYTPDTYGPAGSSTYGSGVSIYTVTANSGFFETIKGSSRILRGVVTEQDILGAPVSEPVQSMQRMVGEGKSSRYGKKGMHSYVR